MRQLCSHSLLCLAKQAGRIGSPPPLYAVGEEGASDPSITAAMEGSISLGSCNGGKASHHFWNLQADTSCAANVKMQPHKSKAENPFCTPPQSAELNPSLNQPGLMAVMAHIAKANFHSRKCRHKRSAEIEVSSVLVQANVSP